MEWVKYWYDGQAIDQDTIELPISDPGLIYGATVFTTLRVYESLDHRLTNWIGHCQRLETSLNAFDWQLPNWERLREGAETMGKQYSVLRIVIFPDGREWITGRFLPQDLAQRQQGITAWIADASMSRSLPHHKTGNYLAPWLALNRAQKFNAQEAILTDSDGNWLETSTGTLWGWHDDRWWTPRSEGILPGLGRSQLIAWLKCQNKEVVEQLWTPTLVKQFSTIAYTNCVMELVPIHTVISAQAKQFYNPTHPSLQRLREYFGSASIES